MSALDTDELRYRAARRGAGVLTCHSQSRRPVGCLAFGEHMQPCSRTTGPDPDVAPRIIISPDGRTVTITGPDDTRRARRVQGEKIGVFEPVYVDVDVAIKGEAVSIFDDVHVNGHVERDVRPMGFTPGLHVPLERP